MYEAECDKSGGPVVPLVRTGIQDRLLFLLNFFLSVINRAL